MLTHAEKAVIEELMQFRYATVGTSRICRSCCAMESDACLLTCPWRKVRSMLDTNTARHVV